MNRSCIKPAMNNSLRDESKSREHLKFGRSLGDYSRGSFRGSVWLAVHDLQCFRDFLRLIYTVRHVIEQYQLSFGAM